MSSELYLPRNLNGEDRIFSEPALLAASSYVVVVAEPGGGKTELMKSLARQLGTTAVTASKFSHVGAGSANGPLIIDAFDELTRVDNSGIYKLLQQAEAANPSHVYVSSRSSEWGNAATSAFTAFLGHPPLVVRLCEFNESEQRAIFEHHVPGEDFAAFQDEVARFDLEALLPNPQFLKLFADAYLESERRFTDKRSIFAQAVERLAREANKDIASTKSKVSPNRKIALSSEVFAKLLMSGAEGVTTSEAIEDRMYPLLTSICSETLLVEEILATRLFKPTGSEDQHRPAHKIVAEYCAASYLAQRIASPTDPLRLFRCLPIIAPNDTVRDELRGLLGWMASLGNMPIQKAMIELDPYAVLANGDPSQLEPSSKRLLLKKLKEVEDCDPYFRRGDSWRKFSVAGFFTPDVIDDLKKLLSASSSGHLRDLLLELLVGAPEIAGLVNEFREIALAEDESKNTRVLASHCLLKISDNNHRADLDVLISEASESSLKVVATAFQVLGPEVFGAEYLAGYFRACADLYSAQSDRHERVIGERYFIVQLISELGVSTIEWLLDELTRDLVCTCGKKPYSCECRKGISKIAGPMLDRYFDIAAPPYDPARIWQWIGQLVFNTSMNAEHSKSVFVLQEDDDLRRGIISHVFLGLTDREEIFETKMYSFDAHSHSGLAFRTGDREYLVDQAFKYDNSDLWASFMASHQYYRDRAHRGVDTLRRHMREQALEKPLFMRDWAQSNRVAAKCYRESRKRDSAFLRRDKRRRRRRDEIQAANREFVGANRDLVESGRHFGFLRMFANSVLMRQHQVECGLGDAMLARTALRNCLDFIDEHIPDLWQLAQLQCESKGLVSESILFAACLEIMKASGNLEGVDLRLLRALRTNIHMGYSSVSEKDRSELKAEIDRLIFPDENCAEDFLRQYVEPQLERPECAHPEVHLLRDEGAFGGCRAALSIEWLERFKGLPIGPLEALFEIAVDFGDRDSLIEIINDRCAEAMSFQPEDICAEHIEQRRKFWLLRAFYFLKDIPTVYWDSLKGDKNTVLMIEARSGRWNRSDHTGWPGLSSEKVRIILDTFIDDWPKVDLPSSYGTDSPVEEVAYRFLTEVIWLIDSDAPDAAIPVLEQLLGDTRFAELHNQLKSIHAGQIKKKALADFEPPTPHEIVALLDAGEIVTVEGMRQLIIQELEDFQGAIHGGEFNSAERFYKGDTRLGEVQSTEIIAERLSLRFQSQNIAVTPEHQLKGAKRSDFTVAKHIRGQRRLVVTEVKGQWNGDLYTAASAQLHERYSIHPDAEKQGIYLAIWFGSDEAVGGRKGHEIGSAAELKASIEATLPAELSGLIDIFVLDVSRN